MFKATAHNVSEHTRLGLIHSLSNKILTKADDRTRIEMVLSSIMVACDQQAAEYETDEWLRSKKDTIEGRLQTTGASVDSFRFQYQSTHGDVFGYTLLVAGLTEAQQKNGKAVIHLLTDVNGPMYSVGLKYRIPSESDLKSFSGNMKKVEAQLQSLGFSIELKRSAATASMDSLVVYDDGPKKDPRFIDLAMGTNIEKAQVLADRMKRSYKKVEILRKRGGLTILAQKKKKV